MTNATGTTWFSRHLACTLGVETLHKFGTRHSLLQEVIDRLDTHCKIKFRSGHIINFIDL